MFSYVGRGASAVGIATSYGLGDRGIGVRVPIGARIFLLSTSFRPVLGPTHPPMQWVPGALSSVVKRPGRETDDSPPASAEVKTRGSMHPLPYTPSWRCA
jgi:hypothetical protein